MRGRNPKRTPVDPRLASPEAIVNRALVERAPRLRSARAALSREDEGYFPRELESCRRAFEAGNLAALYEALFICRSRETQRYVPPEIGALGKGVIVTPDSDDFWMDIPTWIWEGCLRALKSYLFSAKVGKAGRTARWVRRYRQDMIDRERWLLVKELRDRGVKFSLDAIWEEAAQQLKAQKPSSPAVGSADAIKKSYRRVEKAIQQEPFRYKVLLHFRVGNL